MAGGRPSTYSISLASEIIKRISEGETVTAISRSEGMPHKSTIFLWSAVHPEFSDQYVAAMRSSGQFKAEKIIDVIEDMRNGTIDAQMAKVEIDALKWMASKHFPKQYGDKTTTESTNINHNINVEVPLSEADKAILDRFGFKD